MTNTSPHSIVKIVSLCLLLAMLTACNDIGVVARIVNEHCEPMENVTLHLTQQLTASAPYGGGSTYISTHSSDEDGYIFFNIKSRTQYSQVYQANGKTKWHEMENLHNISRGKSGVAYFNGKPVTIDYYRELSKSSKQNPFYLYILEPLPEGLEASYTHDLLNLVFSQDIQSFMPKSQVHNMDDPVLLQWQWRDGLPILRIYGVGNGGVYAITESDKLLPSAIKLNYQKYLEYSLSHGLFRQSFYIKGPDNLSYGVFSIELFYDENIRTAHATLYTYVFGSRRRYRSNKKPTTITYLPVDTCGGALSRTPGGYYATLSKNFLNYLRARIHHPNTPAHREKNKLMRIASDPDTSLDWIRSHIPGIPKGQEYKYSGYTLAIAALDNNAVIEERFRYLFKIAKDNNWAGVLERIATDRRIPSDLLDEFYHQHGNEILYKIKSNPKLSRGSMNRMLDFIQQQTTSDIDSILADFAGHPNASKIELARVWNIYKQLLSANNTPVNIRANYTRVPRYLLKHPQLSKTIFVDILQYIPDYDRAEHFYQLSVKKLQQNDWSTDTQLRRKVQQSFNRYKTSLKSPPRSETFKNLERTIFNSNATDNANGVALIAELIKLKQSSPDLFGLLRRHHYSKFKIIAKGKAKLPLPINSLVRELYYNKPKLRRNPKIFASSIDTPVDILEDIFTNTEDATVINLLARNPTTPLVILHKINQRDFVITEDLGQERHVARSLFCNPALDDRTKARLPYQSHRVCED